MCCVYKRLCNTVKIAVSSPTLSAYPLLLTLSVILLNRHVNNKRITNKPIPHDIVFGFGRDRLASKKESTRNLPNGLHEKHEKTTTNKTVGDSLLTRPETGMPYTNLYVSQRHSIYIYFLDFFRFGW